MIAPASLSHLSDEELMRLYGDKFDADPVTAELALRLERAHEEINMLAGAQDDDDDEELRHERNELEERLLDVLEDPTDEHRAAAWKSLRRTPPA